MNVDDRLIPLMPLGLFGIAGAEEDASRGIVVIVGQNGDRAGLVACEILGQQQIVIKSLGDAWGGDRRVGWCSHAGWTGRTDLDVEGLAALANESYLRRWRTWESMPRPSMIAGDVGRAGKYADVRLGDEEYGVEIMRVKEIIGLMPITDRCHDAAVHTRRAQPAGQGHPVLDLRGKFGMERADDTEFTCIVVVDAYRTAAPR